MTKEKVHSLYLIRNSVNGKLYVGITVNCQNRWKRHIRQSTQTIRQALHLAIAKYGVANFAFKEIENYPTWSDACLGERSWIATLKANGYQLYNETDGGEGSYGVQKFGAANPNYGKKMKPHVQAELLKHRTKLTDAQVESIKTKFATGQHTQTALAEEFGISLTQVHRIVHGKRRRGANNDKSLLTKPNLKMENAIEIRRLYATGGVTQKCIAAKYNISTNQVSRIILGKRW